MTVPHAIWNAERRDDPTLIGRLCCFITSKLAPVRASVGTIDVHTLVFSVTLFEQMFDKMFHSYGLQ